LVCLWWVSGGGWPEVDAPWWGCPEVDAGWREPQGLKPWAEWPDPLRWVPRREAPPTAVGTRRGLGTSSSVASDSGRCPLPTDD
jgi:hypothetical protein